MLCYSTTSTRPGTLSANDIATKDKRGGGGEQASSHCREPVSPDTTRNGILFSSPLLSSPLLSPSHLLSSASSSLYRNPRDEAHLTCCHTLHCMHDTYFSLFLLLLSLSLSLSFSLSLSYPLLASSHRTGNETIVRITLFFTSPSLDRINAHTDLCVIYV